MDTFKEAKALIDAQEEIISAAQEEIERIHSVIVKKFSPVKIGDIVEVNRYSHKGKQMQIVSVRLTFAWNSKNGAIRATGRVLKKDGKPGANCAESEYPPIAT